MLRLAFFALCSFGAAGPASAEGILGFWCDDYYPLHIQEGRFFTTRNTACTFAPPISANARFIERDILCTYTSFGPEDENGLLTIEEQFVLEEFTTMSIELLSDDTLMFKSDGYETPRHLNRCS